MRAVQPIKAGNEILNDYGPLPRSDLLRMYGYTTENYAQYDVVELSSETIDKHLVEGQHVIGRATARDILTRLEELGLEDDTYLLERQRPECCLHDAIPAELHMYIAAIQEDNEKGEAFKASKYKGENAGWGIAEASLLSSVLTKRLTEYKSTLAEDEALLKMDDIHGALATDALPKRFEAAVRVRKGEKEILHQHLKIVNEFLAAKTEEIATSSSKRKRAADEPTQSRKNKSRRL